MSICSTAPPVRCSRRSPSCRSTPSGVNLPPAPRTGCGMAVRPGSTTRDICPRIRAPPRLLPSAANRAALHPPRRLCMDMAARNATTSPAPVYRRQCPIEPQAGSPLVRWWRGIWPRLARPGPCRSATAPRRGAGDQRRHGLLRNARRSAEGGRCPHRCESVGSRRLRASYAGQPSGAGGRPWIAVLAGLGKARTLKSTGAMRRRPRASPMPCVACPSRATLL